jgi:phage shock protein A
MNNMITKLSSVAALLGVVGAIGAGFVQYGKLTAKIDELDNRKAVINETVDLDPIVEKIATLEVDLIDRIQEVENKIKPTDLTGLLKSIQEVREQVVGLKIPNVKPIEDALKELEEYAWELEENIEQLSKDVAIVKKENELQNVLIEELKKSTSNPLGG